MRMEPYIRKSLTDAGIGSLYHEQTLNDGGKQGMGLGQWLNKTGGEAFKLEGKSLIMRGFDRTPIYLLSRILHLKSVGVRLCSLSRLMNIQKYGGEKWEDIQDCRALFVLPSQNERECPLTPWQMDLVEDYMTSRMIKKQSVVLCFDMAQPEKQWWSKSFLKEMQLRGADILASDIEKLAPKEPKK